MQNRLDLYSKPGGDTLQMEKTKEGLEKLGIKVDISTNLHPDLKKYDIVHLFNITRIHETLAQAKNAKLQKKPIVLTPIYHIQSEIDYYEKYGRTGALKYLASIGINFDTREILKVIYRSIKDRQQFKLAIDLLTTGFYKSQFEALSLSDVWCVLANSENNRINKDFLLKKPFILTPNGVDDDNVASISSLPNDVKNMNKFLVCVGRIEDRKNQLSLIKAVGGEIPIVFVGKPNPFHKEYVKQFYRTIKKIPNIIYFESLPHDQILALNKLAQVNVSVSWFEVLSLVSLEAAKMGCNIVTTNVGYIEEYLGQKAIYCCPDDISSIKKAIKVAFNHPKNGNLIKDLQYLTWDNTAKKVEEAYKIAIQTKR